LASSVELRFTSIYIALCLWVGLLLLPIISAYSSKYGNNYTMIPCLFERNVYLLTQKRLGYQGDVCTWRYWVT